MRKKPEYDVTGYVRELVPTKKRRVQGPRDVEALVKGLKPAKREVFAVLLLNARHELIKRVTISVGSLNASIVHPREVFRPAIIEAASAIILVHNHPSGDPEPSDEDLAITRKLREAGNLLGIGVLDHVIVATRGTTSLRAEGRL